MIQPHNKDISKRSSMVHIRVHTIMGIALLALVIMQFSQSMSETVLKNLMVERAQSIQANQVVVSEQFLKVDNQTLTLWELERMSDNVKNIHNGLIEIQDILMQCAPSEQSERKQASLIAIYHDFYRFMSYTLPVAQSGKIHDDTLLLTPTDCTKLELVGNICRIMNKVSEEFATKESKTLKAELINREACMNQQYEAISDYLKQKYAFEMLSTQSYSDSILAVLFD